MNSLKHFDISYLTEGKIFLAGVDEAGRGPLAGPVVAAAVMFDTDTFHEIINDSKKLSEVKREFLYDWIVANSISFGIGIVDHKEIDEINILQASLKAMKLAVDELLSQPEIILIDGNKSFLHAAETIAVVKGDSKSFSVAAASILAKVTRDKIMRKSAEKFPNYGWERNKGYATKKHISAIKKYGAAELHRTTFLGKILPQCSNKSTSVNK
ncbi:MAG: ribonuclease HII [Ignavibacteria bacterium]|nr:MAG: ribonuclease HII [Ignavibacteria bacterium]KAF0160505.1 MAG: ribonuclease HII [Ignavibacteria bacterium]